MNSLLRLCMLSSILFVSVLISQEHAKKMGIAASPLTAPNDPERFLTLAQHYRPDFIELKTTCDIYRASRKQPHIAYCPYAIDAQIDPSSLFTLRCTTDIPQRLTRVSLVNSVGLASADPDDVQKIVQEVVALFKKHGVSTNIIFSIHGDTLEGFINMAHRAVAARVPYVSINLSCPNTQHAMEPLYKDPDYVFAVTSAVKKVLGAAALIVKLGAFSDCEHGIMEKVIQAIARGKADGVCGINSIPVRAVNANNEPLFGSGREICGATGFHIKEAALKFAQTAHALIKKNKYKLRLFACGGAETPEDFDAFFNAGVDVVLCATAILCNPAFAFPSKAPQRAKL